MCPKADSFSATVWDWPPPLAMHHILPSSILSLGTGFLLKIFFSPFWQVLTRNFWSDTHILEICLFPILTPGSPPHSTAISFFFFLPRVTLILKIIINVSYSSISPWLLWHLQWQAWNKSQLVASIVVYCSSFIKL